MLWDDSLDSVLLVVRIAPELCVKVDDVGIVVLVLET